MIDDPVLGRSRSARHHISAKFDHDPKKLGAYYEAMSSKAISSGDDGLIHRLAETLPLQIDEIVWDGQMLTLLG